VSRQKAENEKRTLMLSPVLQQLAEPDCHATIDPMLWTCELSDSIFATNVHFVLPRVHAGILRWFVFVVLLSVCTTAHSENIKSERHRAEQILNLVSRDVQNNFYDESLKGLDWAALTEQARQRIENAEQHGEMMGAISALLYQLHDSHTSFIPPQRKIKARYGFKAQPFANKIFVYQIDKDGPAAKAGLQLGDEIVGVNNLNATRGTFFSVMRYLTVLDPRPELDIEVTQNGSGRIVKVPATLITQPPEYFFASLESGRDDDVHERFYDFKDYGDGICYLRVRTFAIPGTEIVGMIKPLNNAKFVILDLRGNGGGILSTMVDFIAHFVTEPFEMASSISRRKSDPIHVKPDSLQIACPLLVLIDSSSASASEMFARSMQIHKRAVVIGDRSSGRANNARFFCEPPGSIKMTFPVPTVEWKAVEFGTEIAVAKILMEGGEELEGRGVVPDEYCIPTPKDLGAERDPCLDRALTMARQAKN
jgi:C-terminal processing protease CtpA/Prc